MEGSSNGLGVLTADEIALVRAKRSEQSDIEAADRQVKQRFSDVMRKKAFEMTNEDRSFLRGIIGDWLKENGQK
jgi:hypothetical protein